MKGFGSFSGASNVLTGLLESLPDGSGCLPKGL